MRSFLCNKDERAWVYQTTQLHLAGVVEFVAGLCYIWASLIHDPEWTEWRCVFAALFWLGVIWSVVIGAFRRRTIRRLRGW